MRYPEYPPVVAEETVRLRRRLDEAGVPPKVADRNLLVATWNIRALGGLHDAYDENPGSPKRNLRGLAHIAEVASRFDVLAIQEVKREVTALRELARMMGPHWGLIVSDVTEGDKGNTERLGFLFDRRRVEPSGLAGELVLPPLESGDPTRQFARTPYAVSFRAGQEEFILVTLHVLYGDVPEEREPELRSIARWMSEWTGRERFHDDLIVLGDFNIDRAGDPRFEIFTESGLTVPSGIRGVRTNIYGHAAKHYDQIAWFMGKIRMDPTGNAGVVHFEDSVFRELSKRSMSYRVSDHLPLWVEFSLDRSREHLADTLSLDPDLPDPFGSVPD